MKVRELMTGQVRACSPDTGLSECCRIMADLNVGAVPVTEGDRVVGIITDRDVVLRAVAHNRSGNVGEFMTRTLVTCTPETDAHEAARMMAEKQIRRLPVVENGRLAGILSLGDLATIDVHVNEAGDALSSISEPSRPGAH